MKKMYKAVSKNSGAMFEYTPSARKTGTGGESAGVSRGRDDFSPRDVPKAIIKYEILETLEESPQLTAFLAKAPFSERAAVIQRYAADPGAEEGDVPLDAIMEEAKLLSRFNHQNILALYDADGDERRFWAALERFEGDTLESVPASRNKTIGDLHPKRVTIDRAGVAKITDLHGVGKLGDNDALEREGFFAFPSPERLDGVALTKRSDVFSLGGIFHHLLLGPPLPRRLPGRDIQRPARCALLPQYHHGGLRRFFSPARSHRTASARKERLPVFAVQFYPKGCVLFHEGSKGDTAYILKEGRVRMSKKVNEKNNVVAVLNPVNIFGEMAVMMRDKRRTATVTALEDIKVIEISYDQYREIMELTPTVIRTILGILAKRLKKAAEDVAKR